MKLVLDCGDALCYTRQFEINGIEADYEDFGEKYDHCPEEAPDYGCGNMRFDSKPATSEILQKYGITVDEYNEVCDKLVEGLSFGCCAWCS